MNLWLNHGHIWSLEPSTVKAVDTKTLRPDTGICLRAFLLFLFSGSEEKQKEEFQAKCKFKIFFLLD